MFGTTTARLRELRDWLKAQGVRSVAMEATGIYWLCPYEVLEQGGLEVVVVNGKYVKNLPGRKTDMKDCQWQATLHAHGLLKPGFMPPAHIRRLQDYLRVRTDHLTLAASHEQHLQKALDRMNVKVHEVNSDLTGTSGLAVVRGILDGVRTAFPVVALVRPQRPDRVAGRGRLCLAAVAGRSGDRPGPALEDREALHRLAGPGPRQPPEWRGRNRAGRLFCVIARSVGRSVDKALGGFYRRLKGRRGGLVANLALARKLAELFWRLMVHGITYVEQGLKKYAEKVAQTEQRLLQKLARNYNLVLQAKAA